MEIDRKTNLILKHSDIYQSDPIFKMMVDNTQFLVLGDIYSSARYVDDFYGTECVRHLEYGGVYGTKA